MKAEKILRKKEDENEYHFHPSDRKFILEAMEEYAESRQVSDEPSLQTTMNQRELYFLSVDDEWCHTRDDIFEETNLDEVEAYVAERFKSKGIFWCKEHSFCGDDSRETCGKWNCDEYEPRNGRSGCCKHYSTVLYTAGKKVTLKRKP